MEPSPNIRTSLRQQFESDRLLGVTFVPIPRQCLRTSRSDQTVSKDSSSPRPARPAQRLSREQKIETLRVLDETKVKSCRNCSLHETRTQTVFGQGDPDARLVFVGEAPGFEEDRQGVPFIGRAGELLTRMIVAMGLTREDVFICNVLKCRPPDNRDPSADEILACSPYLREQLETISPEVIVALGAPAAKTLLNTTDSIGRLRGRFHDYHLSGETGTGPSLPLMPTYHPAYLLRSPGEKVKAWEDLKLVMRRLGLPLPG